MRLPVAETIDAFAHNWPDLMLPPDRVEAGLKMPCAHSMSARQARRQGLPAVDGNFGEQNWA